jgi:hypothetical protein
VGNLSASDLRCLLPHQFGRLALPVARFVAEQCASSLMVVSVSPRSTLGAVLDRFAFSCVHHVYVVDGATPRTAHHTRWHGMLADTRARVRVCCALSFRCADEGRPLRMITPTDVLRLITPPSDFSVAESEPLTRQLAAATASKATAAAAAAAARREAVRVMSPPPSPAADELARDLQGLGGGA